MTSRQKKKIEEEIKEGFKSESVVKAMNADSDADANAVFESEMEEEYDAEKEIYSGTCINGPLDGQHGESRFPKGFVLIDKPNSRAWVYDYDSETGTFGAREQDIHDRERAMKAAEGTDYDVRAYDREGIA